MFCYVVKARVILRFILGILFLSAPLSVFAQVPAAATQGGWPFVVGGGYSYFKPGVANGQQRLEGPAVWVDWNPSRGSSALSGFGLEGEYRDLEFGESKGQNLRQYTAGGGPMYTLRALRGFHPYGKFLINLSGMEHFQVPGLPSYTSDRWTTYAMGGGLEVRAWRHIWLRGDYEYQLWSVGLLSPTAFVKPQGFTAGAAFDFWRLPRR